MVIFIAMENKYMSYAIHADLVFALGFLDSGEMSCTMQWCYLFVFFYVVLVVLYYYDDDDMRVHYAIIGFLLW